MFWKKIGVYGMTASLILGVMITMTGCNSNKLEIETDNNTVNTTEIENNLLKTSNGSNTENEQITVEYKKSDLDDNWEDSDTTIECNGTKAAINGTGAAIENGIITISKEGTYVLSGKLKGQIRIEVSKEEKVHLIFNGITINSKSKKTAAVYGIQSDKIIITLAEGTTNKLADAKQYEYEEGEDEPNAALFSKDDITINGTGTLIVKGNYNNGIRSKNDIKIVSGVVKVTSVNNGIKGKDSVIIKEGDITIKSKGDAIQSDNTSEEGKGYIILEGGNYYITSDEDGIQAETIVQITGGTYEITTGGGSQNAVVKTNTNEKMRRWDETETADSTEAEQEDTTVSTKGIKAGNKIIITGGEIKIDSADDTIHCNGDIIIEEGIFQLLSGDDGIHADNALVINNGTIIIDKSYEGLEGKTIEVNGGKISIAASDDGINAADSSSSNESWGDRNNAANTNTWIRITEGYLVVDSGTDGIDSNGNFYMDGGTLLVNGPVNGGDSALDYDGSGIITGGILVVAGSSGMTQGLSEESTQNSISVFLDQQQQANTIFHISDNNGNSIVSFAPAKTYQSIIVSTPELKTGEIYSISVGGSVSGEETDGYYINSTYSGGEQMDQVTIQSSVTTSGSGGNMRNGGMNRGGDTNRENKTMPNKKEGQGRIEPNEQGEQIPIPPDMQKQEEGGKNTTNTI